MAAQFFEMYYPKSPENLSSSKLLTKSPTGVNEDSVHDVNYRELSSDSLFKHLENLEWKKAENVLHESPGDARQWAIKDTSDRPAWRRLPIHEACIRQPPAEIVSLMLEVFPSCSEMTDNYDRTPLHYAVIHHASSQVLYLLLDSNYSARNEKDFFGMTPMDYCSSSNSKDAESMFLLDHIKIKELASQTRSSEFNSSLFHPSSQQKYSNCAHQHHHLDARIQHKLQAYDSLQLEEELAQARVEADAAYAQRDVALAEKDTMMEKINELEDILQLKQQEIDDMQDLNERNRHLSALLKHFEEKNKSLQNLVSEKDKNIELLKDELRKNSEAKVMEASALATKYQKEKEKLMSTVSVLTEKLSEMTINLNDAVSELEQSQDDGNINNSMDSCQTELQCLNKFKKYAEEKMKSLEEMVEVYRSAANALQIRCHALEQKCVHQKNNFNFSSMKNDLIESERIRRALEKEVSLLTSYNVKTNERVEIQDEILIDYRMKLQRLEESYYQVTEQLIEKTKMLCQA